MDCFITMKQVFVTALILHIVAARPQYPGDAAVVYENFYDGLGRYKFVWRLTRGAIRAPYENEYHPDTSTSASNSEAQGLGGKEINIHGYRDGPAQATHSNVDLENGSTEIYRPTQTVEASAYNPKTKEDSSEAGSSGDREEVPISTAASSSHTSENDVEGSFDPNSNATAEHSSEDILKWIETYLAQTSDGKYSEVDKIINQEPTVLIMPTGNVPSKDESQVSNTATGLDEFGNPTGIEFPNRVGKPVIITLQGSGR